MANKFTQGKWEVNNRFSNQAGIPIYSKEKGKRKPIAWTNLDMGGFEFNEIEANAKLIAAAPDMLEALNKLLSSLKTLEMNDRLKHLDNDTRNNLSYSKMISEKAIKKATS